MRATHVGGVLAAVLLASAACQNKATPTPPSPVVTSITISSSKDMLKVRETFTFAATATRSDGSTVAVNDWRSDTTAVATVEASTGKVTGVGPGVATLTASYNGMNATKAVRVVPDFAGTWKGEFKMTSCSMSGEWSGEGWDPCDTYTRIGPAQFQFTQDGDRVTGSVEFSTVLDIGPNPYLHPIKGPVSGTINEGGHLKLTGVFLNPTDHVTYSLTAAGNDLHISSDRIVGSFKVEGANTFLSARLGMAFDINGDGLTKVQ